ncbi:MAG TPA: radical SAM protein [Spirochaetia bacterium]|nr:radical SAM protein [Spirochaetia bacterium]
MSAAVLDYLRLRILTFYREALMLRDGRMPAPRMCILYPTYACNHRCTGCDYAELTRKARSFSSGEMDHVLDELLDLGVQSVEFCGGGEPTLHPDLPRAMDRLAERRVAFGLLTNGTNLTEGLVDRLVREGSYCRVSVEAASRQVFDAYKRPSNGSSGFEVVMAGIERLVRARNRSNARLRISYKYSIDVNNACDAAAAVGLAASLGVDSLQYKCVRNVPSEIADEGLLASVRAGVARAREAHPGLDVVENLGKSFLRRCRCWLSPLQLTIDPFGDVYICCYYRHRREKHRLGNLFQRGLRDIWYSEDHWRKLDEIDLEDCNRYDCRFHAYNELLHELVVEDGGQFAFI